MIPSHPTILIGFGQYGRIVMRRLLQEGLDQGALVWDDPSKEEGLGARSLRNLAFLWVSEERGEDLDPGGELARDLYSQIRKIAPDYQMRETQRSLRSALAEAAVAAKDRLLNASNRLPARERMRVGLDVIILAQPNGPEFLGRLEDLLEPLMKALADDRSLERPASGSSLLNFLLFLDFDSYWESPDVNQRIRTGLQASVSRWHLRQKEDRPGFSRIYLMDGQLKEQGRRLPALRIEELIVLLCLMLFERKRDDPGLRGLFEKEHDEISPLATFGIRALERRQDLLALLSAAKFATGWLEYLMGSSASDEGASLIRRQLAPYQPGSLELFKERTQLQDLVEAGLDEIETKALSLSLASEVGVWQEDFTFQLEGSLTALKARLSAWTGQHAGRASSPILRALPARLNEIVMNALDHAREPLSPGFVVQELSGLRQSLETPPPPAAVPDDPSRWEALAQSHGTFSHFRAGRINPANLGRWWPLLAAVVSAAWTPVVLDAVDAVPPPDPDTFLISKAYELMEYLAQPWLVAVFVFALGWIVGRLWFEPQIRKWLSRGSLGWTHNQQGVLTDRLRRTIRSGPIADIVRSHAEQVWATAIQRVHADVRRELDRVLERLRARTREMQWLRNEMREFLRTHGIDPDALSPHIEASNAAVGGYRTFMERDADFQKILALNPATPERYHSAQTENRAREPEKRLIHGWLDDYCDSFLYPVVFLENLSRNYYHVAATPDEVGGAVTARTEMEHFLTESGQFSLAFDWSVAPGAVPDLQTWCVMPATWRTLPGIAAALSDHGFVDQRIVDGNAPDRVYFLKVQWGVSPDRLTRHDASFEATGASDLR